MIKSVARDPLASARSTSSFGKHLGGETTRLLSWLDDPRGDRGLHLFGGSDEWSFLSYEELAGLAHRCAARLRHVGMQPNQVVAIGVERPDLFAASFFGVLVAGCIPCPVPAPLPFQGGQVYRTRVGAQLDEAMPGCLVGTSAFLDLVDEARFYGFQRTINIEAVLADDDVSGGIVTAGHHGLLQFTSGSTGAPKGALVSASALDANISCIGSWLDMTSSDIGASWLPTHHDMGLIGGLLAPIVNQVSMRLMTPSQFVRKPQQWLDCFGKLGASMGPSPSFALDYVSDRVTPEDLEGSSYEDWRTVIVGAERIRLDTLTRFADLLAPFGFHHKTFRPAYGMAEATLLVTGRAKDGDVTTAAVSSHDLKFGKPVTLDLGAATDSLLLSNGRPVGDTEIEIIDDDGTALPEMFLGEIVISSGMLADRYWGRSEQSSEAFRDGKLFTGDAGFLREGELFVIGRLSDAVTTESVTLFAEELEANFRALMGSNAAVPIVLLGHVDAEPHCYLVVTDRESISQVQPARTQLLRDIGSTVFVCKTRAVLRTTSGKPRRCELWHAVSEDADAFQALPDSLPR